MIVRSGKVKDGVVMLPHTITTYGVRYGSQGVKVLYLCRSLPVQKYLVYLIRVGEAIDKDFEFMGSLPDGYLVFVEQEND